MKTFEVIGYFKEDKDRLEELQTVSDNRLLYFVAYKNSDGAREWVEGYNVIDGHFQLKDGVNYLQICTEITKENYLKETNGLYTPEIYL